MSMEAGKILRHYLVDTLNYFRYFEAFFIVCAIYLILTSIMTLLLNRFERVLTR